MPEFDGDSLEEFVRAFDPKDPASRNVVLDLCRQRLHLMAHRMLRGFPGVHRLEDTDDILQGALIRNTRHSRLPNL